LTEALKALSQREAVTLFMALLAVFKVLLYRYTGQTDILVGSPIANRNRSEIEKLIGFFVNMLVLRTDLSGDPTFLDVLGQVREVALGAYDHQDVPFEKLVEELQPQRDLSRQPLFQVQFVLQNTPSVPELPGLIASSMKVESSTAKFDLTLFVEEDEQGLKGKLEYNTDLFDAATIARMAGHFQTLIQGIVSNPEQRLSELPLLTETERRQLLFEWNNLKVTGDTRTEYPQGQCMHQLFEAQVERTPDAIAVIFEEQQLTYRELNRRANQLARYLQTLGVGPEVLVGICVERSLEMVIGVLGVLKAGGTCVPLDPSYPRERLVFMLEDTHTPVLLTQELLVADLPRRLSKAQENLASLAVPVPSARARGEGSGVPHGDSAEPSSRGRGLERSYFPIPQVVCLDSCWETIARESDENPFSAVTVENLVYVLYTSGSTGRPKGVALPHRALFNMVAWQLRHTALPEGARTLQFSSLSFDASFADIFMALCSGGALVIVPDSVRRNIADLPQLITDYGVERLNLPVVVLQYLAGDIDAQAQLALCAKEIISTGEQLQVTQYIREFFTQLPNCVLHNQYGPSESHVVTSFTLTGSPDDWPALPPIGRSIANAQIYLLDQHLRPVPIGIPGELYIGGVCLARSYLNRPDTTAERFIPDPFSGKPGARLYKTGDLARYLPDGNIEFLGRLDHQVKIRGFRIELGEIETVLSQHPAVREVVVIARENLPGDKRLVAYFIAAQATAPTLSELRGFLKEKLPDYMIPSAFMRLDAMPLTPNGKVDRRALPPPDTITPMLEQAFVAPRDSLELRLVQMWEDILNIHPIGVTDDFFNLGGHSLLVVHLMARIQSLFGRSLPLSAIFRGATVEHLASILRQQSDLLSQSPLVAIQQAGPKRPFFCVHPGSGTVLYYAGLARHLGSDRPFYGLQAPGLNGEQAPYTRIKDLAAYYTEALCATHSPQAQGPYLLGGWSTGGIIAFEMAQQLQQQGHQVALLVLIDSSAPLLAAQPADFDQAALLSRFIVDLGNQFKKDLVISADELRLLEPDNQLYYALQKAKLSNVLPAGAKLDQFQNIFDVYVANLYASRNYLSQPYSGRIVLFRADQAVLDPSPDRLRGHEMNQGESTSWQRLAAGSLETHIIPGNHYTMLTQPNVQILAKLLKRCLAQAQADDLD
jgi:amino acid adenylation domain-containing protein